MNKINIINSRTVLIDIENIDTDQIIPSRFLKLNNKKKFSNYLFADWRYEKNGKLKKNFILNKIQNIKDRKIIITGKNFGCGSSREHAVWAILDYGFEAIISSFFADIFKNNALNNGLLPIQISETDFIKIKNIIKAKPNTKIKIILEKEKIYIKNLISNFKINSYKKNCLLNGYDDLQYLMSMKNIIQKFEKNIEYLLYTKKI